MRRRAAWIVLLCCFFPFCLAGCEETDLRLATEAGLDALKAATLSDETVRSLAREAATHADGMHPLAPENSPEAERLRRLLADHGEQGNFRFEVKVYLVPEVNAFAMADGTIRFFSGLMEMMDDDELRFVLGHEMGHVVHDHVRKRMQLAYAGSALRKGIAAQNNAVGAIARSELGAFVEQLTGAQFSQQEEKEADDYGLAFLRDNGYRPEAAVTALRKLATLGDNHSFLASHPAPSMRAERLERVLRGEMPEEERKLAEKIMAVVVDAVAFIREKINAVIGLLRGMGILPG